MNRAPIGTFQLDGHTLLCTEMATQRCPAQINLAGFDLEADAVHDVIGEHRDEQMPADTVLVVVENRTQAQFRLEAAEAASRLVSMM